MWGWAVVAETVCGTVTAGCVAHSGLQGCGINWILHLDPQNLPIDCLALSSSLLTPALESEPHRQPFVVRVLSTVSLVPRTVIALPLLTWQCIRTGFVLSPENTRKLDFLESVKSIKPWFATLGSRGHRAQIPKGRETNEASPAVTPSLPPRERGTRSEVRAQGRDGEAK